MRIRNTTNETRETWTGQGVNAGDVFDASGLPENELEWLLRHGFEKVGKPKSKTRPVADLIVETVTDELVAPVFAPKRRTRKKKS